MWTVAPRGITKSLIPLLTLFCLAHSKFTGIVATDDCVPTAVKYPFTWFLISLIGFSLCKNHLL